MINANPIGASMPQRPLTIVGLGASTTPGTPAFRSPLESPPDGQAAPATQNAHWLSPAAAAPSAPPRLRGSPDGLHPGVDGYRRMGDTLTRTIEAHLARLATR